MGKYRQLLLNPYFFFPALVLIVFWPLSFQLFTFKNDALTYYYPVRVLISDALRNHELPLWSPFINMGYPLHADMQSAAWNPVVWLLGYCTKYQLGIFHFEFLLYIALAGIGFYHLMKNYGCNKATALAVGVCFQFSGFMIDGAQFFATISSAAYLPFVFLFFRRTVLRADYYSPILLGLSLSLFFTGGYPSLFIITCYVLAVAGLYFLLGNGGLRSPGRLFCIGKRVGAASIVFLLFSLPAIISFYHHLPHIARGYDQPLSFVQENSLNPSNLVSFISPFAALANDSWLSASVIMRNVYIGLLPLVFIVAAMFQRQLRGKNFWLYMATAVFMLGAAFGNHFILRELLYDYVPLMGSFRHPTLFRIFAIFFLLIAAGKSFQLYQNNPDFFRPFVQRALLFIAAFLFAMLMIGACIDMPSVMPGKLSTNWFAGLHFSSRLLMQSIFIFPLMLAIYVLVKRKFSPKAMLFIVVADMFLATQLNIPATVIGAKPFAEIQSAIDRNYEKFPLPGNSTLANLADSSENFVTGSLLPMRKIMSRNNYYFTPGNLRLQDSFYFSALRQKLFFRPVVFISPMQQYDSIAPQSKATLSALSSNSAKVEVEVAGKSMLVYQQNDYPGWKAFVDGKRVSIVSVNITEIGIPITTGGKHTIELVYRPAYIKTSFFISVISFCVFLLVVFSRYQASKRQREIA